MLQSVKDTVMSIVKGCVGDKVITVLRDTGCSGAVIRKELVLDAQKFQPKSKPEVSVRRWQLCGHRSGRSSCRYTILHRNCCRVVF